MGVLKERRKKKDREIIVKKPGKVSYFESAAVTEGRLSNLNRKINWNAKMIKLLEKHVNARSNNERSPIKDVTKTKKAFETWFGKSYTAVGSESMYSRYLIDRTALKASEIGKARSHMKALSHLSELTKKDAFELMQDLHDANLILRYEHDLRKKEEVKPIWFNQPSADFITAIRKQLETSETRPGFPQAGFDEGEKNILKLGLPERLEKKALKLFSKEMIHTHLDKMRAAKSIPELESHKDAVDDLITISWSSGYIHGISQERLSKLLGKVYSQKRVELLKK